MKRGLKGDDWDLFVLTQEGLDEKRIESYIHKLVKCASEYLDSMKRGLKGEFTFYSVNIVETQLDEKRIESLVLLLIS